MGRSACCVTSVADLPKHLPTSGKHTSFGTNCVEMGEIVNSPFWPQCYNDITTPRNAAVIEHKHIGSGNYISAFASKYINAFVDSRFAPGLIPESFSVPIFGSRPLHRYQSRLWNQEADENWQHYTQQNHISFCHNTDRGTN